MGHQVSFTFFFQIECTGGLQTFLHHLILQGFQSLEKIQASVEGLFRLGIWLGVSEICLVMDCGSSLLGGGFDTAAAEVIYAAGCEWCMASGWVEKGDWL
ncbi:hypothetical protein CMQ_6308 [Grosmannia clavigera kw1407]|uniref:Uncharacterized protein n=1 Tax=Grosmannia clavigera (strain kw1407 / UAMH 11150) TaxID=655863 RepID=F0XLW2_GROCL|nr:uncharacterized protein CMQ_6308 [Grosmannia clavigera kw1407]EFX01366.1 hypothetical protein CMQ_6308 [Grosmannia clavigera kw1407]